MTVYQLFDLVLRISKQIHPSDAEMGIFWVNYVNTIAADALAPCVTTPSAAMELIRKDKWFQDHEKGFQLHVSVAPQCWEIMSINFYVF